MRADRLSRPRRPLGRARLGVALAGALGAALAGALPPPASAGTWAPKGWARSAPDPGPGPTNPASLPLGWALRFYRATVSRVDGDRCPSYPSCSAYAVQAVREHGPLLGFLLTAGRLVSEADEAAFAPRIRVGGRWKVYSPVDDDLAFLRGPLDP